MTKLTILAAAALVVSAGGALAQTYALPGSYPTHAAPVAGPSLPGLGQGALVARQPDADAVETGSIRAPHRNAAAPRAR